MVSDRLPGGPASDFSSGYVADVMTEQSIASISFYRIVNPIETVLPPRETRIAFFEVTLIDWSSGPKVAGFISESKASTESQQFQNPPKRDCRRADIPQPFRITFPFIPRHSSRRRANRGCRPREFRCRLPAKSPQVGPWIPQQYQR